MITLGTSGCRRLIARDFGFKIVRLANQVTAPYFKENYAPKAIGGVNMAASHDPAKYTGPKFSTANWAAATPYVTTYEEPLKLFISNVREDEKWRAKFAPNLGLLQREGLVEVWCDLEIRAGTDGMARSSGSWRRRICMCCW